MQKNGLIIQSLALYLYELHDKTQYEMGLSSKLNKQAQVVPAGLVETERVQTLQFALLLRQFGDE